MSPAQTLFDSLLLDFLWTSVQAHPRQYQSHTYLLARASIPPVILCDLVLFVCVRCSAAEIPGKTEIL